MKPHSAASEERRLAAVRAAVSGDKHWLWKGDDAGYFALHSYLSLHFPKTGICEECGAGTSTQYALIKGRAYSRNRDDYRELCPRCHRRYDQGGELNPQAKLTEEQVAEIRRRYRPGRSGHGVKEGSTRALAAEFGVSHTTIRHIVSGRKWGHVTDPPGRA